jgi:hypothetical protein
VSTRRDPARRLGRLTAGAIALYALGSLWPFWFELPAHLPNGATPSPEGGLAFATPGLAESDGPPAWVQAALDSQSLQLDLSLRSEALPSSQFKPILTLARDKHRRNLTLAQEGRELVLELRTPDSSDAGRAFVVRNLFPAPEWTDVVVAVEPGRVRVTVNGVKRVDRELPTRPLASWDPSYGLALGNEPAGNRPWIGALRRAEVRAGTTRVDLAAPGVLRLPERFWYMLTPPQIVPLRDSSIEDIVVNSLLYVPLGLLLGARHRASGGRSRPRPWVAVLLVSGTIELLQLFVSVRCASTGDLLLNVLGGAAGAWLGGVLMLEWMVRRLRVGPAQR